MTIVVPLETSATAPMPTSVDFWELASFEVAAGSATPRMIPTLPAATTTMSLEAAGAPFQASPSPMTTSTDDLAPLDDYNQTMAADAAARQAAFDAALRIENPHDHSPDTIDCASCHLAAPARQLVGEPLGLTAAGDPAGFVPDASIPAADLMQTTELVGTDGVLNIHAFSYRQLAPMINQRVINETAANLAYLATQL
jgi:hypothetical protein